MSEDSRPGAIAALLAPLLPKESAAAVALCTVRLFDVLTSRGTLWLLEVGFGVPSTHRFFAVVRAENEERAVEGAAPIVEAERARVGEKADIDMVWVKAVPLELGRSFG